MGLGLRREDQIGELGSIMEVVRCETPGRIGGGSG